eukprot:gene20289-22275_t
MAGIAEKRKLHDLCHNGKLHQVKEYLASDPNAIMTINEQAGVFGYTPLHEAVSSKNAHILRILLTYGGFVDALSNGKYTPLHIAASIGAIDCIKVLLEYGADISLYDEFGKTPFVTAQLNKRKKAARLLKTAEIKKLAQTDSPRIGKAIETLQCGQDVEPNCFDEALIEAVKRNNHKSVGYLVIHGAKNVEEQMKFAILKPNLYQTAVLLLLCHAAKCGDKIVVEEICKGLRSTNFSDDSHLAKIGENKCALKRHYLPELKTQRTLWQLRKAACAVDMAFPVSIALNEEHYDVAKVIVFENYCNIQGEADWHGLALSNIQPSWIEEIRSYKKLVLSHNNLNTVPIKIIKMKHLLRLDLAKNVIDEIPKEIFELPLLRNLNLSNNEISQLPKVNEWSKSMKILNLEGNNLRVLHESIEQSELEDLNLSRNSLIVIQDCICNIKTLTTLDFSSNSSITVFPPELAKLTKLSFFGMKNMSQVTDPPPGLRENTTGLLRHLRARLRNSEAYYTMKLMIVGFADQGKTTLMHRLDKDYAFNQNHSTRGVQIKEIVITGTPPFVFKFWDFAGQEEYYSTHQCFLSQRSLYILVWNVTKREKGIGSLESWLDNLETRVPNSTLIIVGTHLDEISEEEKSQGFEMEMNRKMHSFVSSYKKINCPENNICMVTCLPSHKDCRERITRLRQLIYSVAENMTATGTPNGQKIMGEKIPSSYLSLAKILAKYQSELQEQNKIPIIRKQEFEALIAENAKKNTRDIFDPEDIDIATKFLHDVGMILHYDDPNQDLRDLYFVNPSWLCELMAKVVTVKEAHSFIKDGILYHKDIEFIIGKDKEKYPKEFYSQYLRLLYRFQIACRIDEERVLIPSQLPKEFSMEKARSIEPDHVLKRQHSFSCIPQGFWSRFIGRFLLYLKDMLTIVTGGKPEESTMEANAVGEIKKHSDKVSLSDSNVNEVEEEVKVDATTIVKNNIGEGNAINTSEDSENEENVAIDATTDTMDANNDATDANNDATDATDANNDATDANNDATDATDASNDATDANNDATDANNDATDANNDVTDACNDVADVCNDVADGTPNATDDSNKATNAITNANNDGTDATDATTGDTNAVEVDSTKMKEESVKEDCINGNGYEEADLTTRTSRYSTPNPNSSFRSNTSPINRSSNSFKVKNRPHRIEENIVLDDLSSLPGRTAMHGEEGATEEEEFDESIDISYLLAHKYLRCWRKGILFSHPKLFLSVTVLPSEGKRQVIETRVSRNVLGYRALSFIVDHIRTLIKEWYPGLSGDNGQVPYVRQLVTCPICNDYGIKQPHMFDVCDCYKSSLTQEYILCPNVHQPPTVSLRELCPDIMFMDLPSSLQLNTRELVYSEVDDYLLGSGQFGKVYRGQYKDQQAAIKLSNFTSADEDNVREALDNFYDVRQEVMILSKVKRHPFIVSFLGVSVRPKLCSVMELATEGSLRRAIQGHMGDVKRIVIYRIAQQISSALSYLHQLGIVHRDLKSDNVLVFSTDPGSEINAKLTDFGTADFMSCTGLKFFAGTAGFVAPEMLQYSKKDEYTAKVDVYSFAMVLYESITKRRPFQETEGEIEINRLVKDRKRPGFHDVPAAYFGFLTLTELMLKAWEHEAMTRPSSKDILQQLKSPGFCLLYGKTLLGKIQSPRYLCFVEESQELWICCDDRSGASIIIVDLANNKLSKQKPFTPIVGKSKDVHFNIVSIHVIDKMHVAVILRSTNDYVQIYSANKKKCIESYQVKDSYIRSLAVSEQFVVIGCEDGSFVRLHKKDFIKGKYVNKKSILVNEKRVIAAVTTTASNCFVGCDKYVYKYELNYKQDKKDVDMRCCSDKEHVSNIALSADCLMLFISFSGSSIITCRLAETMNLLGDIDCADIIKILLPASDIYDQRVTCFALYRDTLWVGTGSGHILIYEVNPNAPPSYITWLRPYNLEVRCMITCCSAGPNSNDFIVTIGKELNPNGLNPNKDGICELNGSFPIDQSIILKKPKGQKNNHDIVIVENPELERKNVLLIFDAISAAALRQISSLK